MIGAFRATLDAQSLNVCNSAVDWSGARGETRTSVAVSFLRSSIGARRRKSVVEEVANDPATLCIRFAHRVPLGVRWLPVFVDNKRIGPLKRTGAGPFPVTPGVHDVRVQCGRAKSESVRVSCSAGERAELVCGYPLWKFDSPRILVMVPLTMVCYAVPQLAVIAGFTALGFALLTVVSSIHMTFAWRYWKESATPGAVIHLRRSTDPPTLDHARPIFAWDSSRITIRLAMIVVAVAALLAAATVRDLKAKREFQYKLLRIMYRSHAESAAARAERFAETERAAAASEEALKAQIEEISGLAAQDRRGLYWRPELEKKRRELASIRAKRALNARSAAHYAELNRKYQNAVARPWEPVPPDPPAPP